MQFSGRASESLNKCYTPSQAFSDSIHSAIEFSALYKTWRLYFLILYLGSVLQGVSIKACNKNTDENDSYHELNCYLCRL